VSAADPLARISAADLGAKPASTARISGAASRRTRRTVVPPRLIGTCPGTDSKTTPRAVTSQEYLGRERRLLAAHLVCPHWPAGCYRQWMTTQAINMPGPPKETREMP
jgi:hypothetical protein